MEINKKVYDTAFGAVDCIYGGNAANWLKDFTHWVESIYDDHFWYNYRTRNVMYKSQIWDFVRMIRRHPEAYNQLKNRWLENASCKDAERVINDIRFIDRIKDDELLFEGVLA